MRGCRPAVGGGKHDCVLWTMKEQDLPHAVRDEGRAKFGEYEVIMTEPRRRKLLPIMNRGVTRKKWFDKKPNA